VGGKRGARQRGREGWSQHKSRRQKLIFKQPPAGVEEDVEKRDRRRGKGGIKLAFEGKGPFRRGKGEKHFGKEGGLMRAI